MPRLTDFRQTKTITLPTFPDSKVEIYSALLVKEMTKFDFDTENVNKIQYVLDKLPMYIKSWNFTDENDKPLEITGDNLGFLKEDDLVYLVNQITEFGKEAKKK